MEILKFEKLKLHVIVWTVFITYEIWIIFMYGAVFTNIYDYGGHYLLNVSLFYFNAHIVLPNAIKFNKRSYLKLFIFIILELALYLSLKYLLDVVLGFLSIEISRPIKSIWVFLNESIYRAIYFIGLSTGYWFAISTLQNRSMIAKLENTKLKNEIQNQKLEKSLLLTENAYLKSQINPHFLLNTLNFLYNSVSKFSDKIADSVLLLSDIMRYALTNADEDGKVMLEAEIDHISSFIKLNQARYDSRLCIDFKVEGEIEGLRIIPLILITLVENVFKYGDLLNKEHPAKIYITGKENKLIFVTENLKRNNTRSAGGYGIGIKNIQNRLSLHYVFDFKVNDEANRYRSELTVEL